MGYRYFLLYNDEKGDFTETGNNVKGYHSHLLITYIDNNFNVFYKTIAINMERCSQVYINEKLNSSEEEFKGFISAHYDKGYQRVRTIQVGEISIK